MAPKTSLLHGLFLLLLVVVPYPIQSMPSGFEFLKMLEGSCKGQTVKGISELKNYMEKFGYMTCDDVAHYHALNDDVFDDMLETAVMAYQQNYHLEANGRLDADTVNQMMKPRCEVPDIVNAKNHHHHHKLKPIQDVSHLKYSFHFGIQVPATENIMRSACSKAFQRWSQVSHFTFEEVPHGTVADIQIGFQQGSHSDGEPFDGQGGIVAHAYASNDGRLLHFDVDENWSMNPSNLNELDLESVAMHEIGHLLGLDHNMVPDAVMFPCFSSGVMKRTLQKDDIQGLNALYGSGH